ncbi:MAG: patatin-like phospholipase family protein [Hyphomicrobium sp.]|uniref:patatin-like phospholipase family protein n=1 Tax=Hyphomicrobium sp. TaxID=82 RepID=UPI003D0DE9F4
MNSLMKVETETATSAAAAAHPAKAAGRIVIVLQGGGALGAYQAGVYHALHDAGIEPDWLIGTSIGAINAALIVGNAPDQRIAALEEFWRRMTQKPIWEPWSLWPRLTQHLTYGTTIAAGLPNFFAPNPMAFASPHLPLGAENAGYYSTAPLEETLTELVDFSRIAEAKPRLTVGAAQVTTSQMHYFDSRDTKLGVKHILASGALPPAFPAVRIDGELYWDGGILSNTPAEVVFDDHPRHNSLVFAVHMWNPVGPEPETMWEVLHRHKDIQYSSRVASHIRRQADIHRLRRVVRELTAFLPEHLREREEVRALAAHGCPTRMHVVRLLAPPFENDDHTKDVDFSMSGIRRRWDQGYEKTAKAIEHAPWVSDETAMEGVFLHELDETRPL